MICLGYGLLCHPFHLVIWQNQPHNSTTANAPNLLGCWYYSQEWFSSCQCWLLVMTWGRHLFWPFFSSPMSILIDDCVNASEPPLPYQLNQRICHIIVDHNSPWRPAWESILHWTTIQTPMGHIIPTANMSCPRLLITTVVAYHIYSTFQSILVTLTLLHQPHHMLWQKMQFPPMHNRSSILIGLSIHWKAGTLYPPSLLAIFPSMSNLLAQPLWIRPRIISQIYKLHSSIQQCEWAFSAYPGLRQ